MNYMHHRRLMYGVIVLASRKEFGMHKTNSAGRLRADGIIPVAFTRAGGTIEPPTAKRGGRLLFCQRLTRR